jgi:hypothetical protein
MGKETLIDKLFSMVAHIGWRLFSFGSRLTEEEYLEQVKQQ